MPERKGKRRRRPRNRPARGVLTVDEDEAPPVPARSARPARTVRKRWQPPFWVNVTLGGGMLIFGLLFFILPQRGVGTNQKVLLFIGYLVVAGFYLVQAYRQYRARQQARR